MNRIRILAGALAALMLAALLSGCGKKPAAETPAGQTPTGIFYEASGIDPKSVVAAINGREVTAEEYLYWLAYHCETVVSEQGDVDWYKVVSDDLTYGEYAQRSALATVIQFCVIRDVSEKYNIGLTDTDRAQLRQQKEENVQRYGGTEGYLRHLEIMGVSEETYDRISENYVLAARLVETAGQKGSDLYPSQDTLDAFMEGKQFATVRMITLSAAGLSDEEKEDQRAMLASCAEQIRQAENPAAKLSELSASLGLTDGEEDQTLGSDASDLTLMRAARELEEGQVSDVVEAGSSMYVMLRRPLDESAIARDCFRTYLLQARQSVKVEVSDSYKQLDVGAFYTKLVELRAPMLEEDKVDQ